MNLDKYYQVKSIFPEAILAGGALRDHDHDKSIKDYDIYVQHNDELGTRLYNAGLLTCKRDDKEYLNSFIQDVLVLEVGEPPYVNLVSVKCPTMDIKSIVDTFDLGLCQIGFDGVTVYRSEAYLSDRANKTMTMLPLDNYELYVRSLRHYERIKDKYPYPLIVPKEMSKFARRYVDDEIDNAIANKKLKRWMDIFTTTAVWRPYVVHRQPLAVAGGVWGNYAV